ncbi:MAG: zinc-ribbon domain-containing protein [Lachnospiraceae bacterium]
MREKLQRFMWGRYGSDRLNQVLMVCALIGFLLSFVGGNLFELLALGLLGYVYFRMFSRNIAKRSAENQWYLAREWKARRWFQNKKREFGERREYKIFKCPNCGQKLRIPRGKGKIEIRCRKCGNEFIGKS